MSRGNVCVTGPCEGLYYISNDHIHVYRRDDPCGEMEPEVRLMGDIPSEELAGGEWLYDEEGTMNEEEDVLECFMVDFRAMFLSFRRPAEEKWFGDRRVILESGLFYIAVEDNQWSLAVELLQKEDPYDDHLSGLQGRHYQRYLEGIKRCLLARVPSVDVRLDAWRCNTIKREETG